MVEAPDRSRTERRRLASFFAILHRKDRRRLISGMGRQLGHPAQEVERNALRSYGKDNASGFFIRGDKPVFLFCDGYDLRCFGYAGFRHGTA